MKRQTNLLRFFNTGILIILLSACTRNFESLNTNPNLPVQVTPDLLLPNIIRTTSTLLVNNAFNAGNLVVQYSTQVSANAYDRYVWDANQGIWNGLYGELRDVDNVLALAESQSSKSYHGIGLVLKTFLFSVLTDTYGDIPYTEAGKAKTDGINEPKYDAQQAIYTALLSNLDSANQLLSNVQNEVPVRGDILYNGDLSKWRKFANSLKIRLLMRISNKTEMNVSGQLSAMINDPLQYPLFAGNEDNAALPYLPDIPNQFPSFTLVNGSKLDIRLSTTLQHRLKGLSDPRIMVYAQPTQSSDSTGTPAYAGVPNALIEGTAASYNGGGAYQSTLGEIFLNKPDAAQGIFMHYAELQFLLAEGAYKNIIPGNAGTYYANGIQAAFSMYNMTVPSGYLTTVQLDNTNGLYNIALQKWISLFYVGLEAWFDWRRTGLPEITPGPANVNNNLVPVRFLYPTIEQSINTTNYQNVLKVQGPDDINTKMWLLK